MRKSSFPLTIIAAIACSSVSLVIWAEASKPMATKAAVMPQQSRSIFASYCLDCHSADASEGKVNLESLSLDIV